MIPQVDQRRERNRREATEPPARRSLRSRATVLGSRSLSSRTMRSDVFFPTPGIAVSRARSPRSIAPMSSTVRCRSGPQGRPSAQSADANPALEQIELERRRKAEERDGVLAHVRVDAQAPLRRCVREPIKRRERNGDVISDAPTSTTTRLGCFSRIAPRRCAITDGSDASSSPLRPDRPPDVPSPAPTRVGCE